MTIDHQLYEWGKDMINRAFLMIAAAIVFAVASPSYATFWGGHHGGNNWSNNNNNDWSNKDWSNNDWRRGGDKDNKKSKKRDRVFKFILDNDCDDQDDRWCDDDRDNKRSRKDNRRCDDNWFDCDDQKWDVKCDWDFDCDDKDWSRDCDWDWKDCDDRKPPRCDNPVPEPATAGLAFMGVGALVAATRRRRK